MKIALAKSNLLRKNEHELREAIRFIAPECWGDETQVILNRNIQRKRHIGQQQGALLDHLPGRLHGRRPLLRRRLPLRGAVPVAQVRRAPVPLERTA